MKRCLGLLMAAIFVAGTAYGQQTGSIAGKVTMADGQGLPGVVVEAASDRLPRSRAVTTLGSGEYLIPSLPPGDYTLTYTMGGMATVTRNVKVLLDNQTQVNVTMGPEAIEEAIEVVAETPYIDPSSTAIKSAVSSDVIEQVPVGQEYRDLQKLIPGVQYTENAVRGPSAGGSGQDNVYQFDGVNVNLPLFGVLSAEPSTHDIEQVSIVKGGAKATDFNRSAGFTVDTVSKSGTNQFHGEAKYQLQNADWSSDQTAESAAEFDQDRDWATLGIGGPIVKENLFFYGSYYRPTITRDNSSNVYGEVPGFESTRDEFFGKLTWTPTNSVLLHGSYRDSDRENQATSIGGFGTPSTSVGEDATLEIAIAEGTWVINDRNFATFKVTDFANETAGRPDTILPLQIAADGSVGLDVNNLDQMGNFFVPSPIDGNAAFNQFIDPLIQQYGYLENGVRRGGGNVGAGSEINVQDFYRESFQVGYDLLLGDTVSHEIHLGYQSYTDEEDLDRYSNGWGVITVPGGRVTTDAGVPIYYQAEFWQSSLAGVPEIHSEFESQNIEINDTIKWNNWSFNVGVLLSQDTLYGQGLREGADTPSGFELCVTCKYEMYQVDFGDQIQPRLGATWAYNGADTVYASFSRYIPAASSLPRAASWARNLRQILRANFDAEGNLIEIDPVESSSGKFFQEDMDPRTVDEYMLGTSRKINTAWSARAYARYRRGYNYWEDTNNNARQRFNPPEGIPQDLYIENLSELQQGIGGSSYVIAELDGAFTKYYEVTLEGERRAGNSFFRGSYTWSHYYGNFDQDNSTVDNDQAIFIGSSNIADGAGRQLWDFKYGNLRGDRRHSLKLYGYYMLPWNATAGAFGVYQSGEPWEAWSYEPYVNLTSSTNETNRLAEPAGSRTSDDHYQVDLNYTQNFGFGRYNLQLVADIFNVTDNQTGYAIDPRVHSANFGQPQYYYDPRRFQLAVRFQF